MLKANRFLKYWQGLFGGLKEQDTRNTNKERNRNDGRKIGIWALVFLLFAVNLLNGSILNANPLPVPFIHQMCDTPDDFNGCWACGGTAAVMI